MNSNTLADVPTEVKDKFETWATRHGGLSLDTAHSLVTKDGLFPATYYDDKTEIAWRAWTSVSFLQASTDQTAREEQLMRDEAQYDNGLERARKGVQKVYAGYEDLPFTGCPEAWGEKVFCRIEWYSDSGDSEAGIPAVYGWTLAEDQSDTVIADLATKESISR